MSLDAAPFATPHEHVYLGSNHARNEKRTWLVIAITAAMMVIEITAGSIYGSMALVADGWHMSTHAGAMLIAALAYRYARRNLANRRFTFGTGKMGDLAGFASAVVLALVALLIGWESLMRLYSPVAIDFQQAIIVAVIGLAVNLVCAWLLRDDHSHHHHGHGHDHRHSHDHEHAHATDNNLRAAYLHVLADALTSVLAIAALTLGSLYSWNWLDPVAMGKNSPGTRLSAAARTFATIYGKIFDVGKRRPAGKANCYGGIHVTLHDIAYGSGNGSDRVSKAKDLPISRHLASGRRQSAWRS
jgi:Co/Zn/Cd efflux system component